MARNSVVVMATRTARSAPARRGRILSLLLLAPLVSGCEAMDRMDFFDQFFEPPARPRPVVAMQPIVSAGDHAPAMDPAPQPTLIRAMDPVANPADYAATQDRTPHPASARTLDPQPGKAPLSEAEAESRTRLLVRQNPWMTRFWMELTPEQRLRVERQLHRSSLRLTAGGPAEPAALWDPMGLSDRVGLVFGKNPPAGRSDKPTEKRQDPTLLEDS
jgi:hypothetical protein